MKYKNLSHYLSFILLFWVNTSLAQRASILSIKNLSGNNSDGIGKQVVHTADGGLIISSGSNSSLSNFGLSCTPSVADTSRIIFQKYDATGMLLQWEQCYHSKSDTLIEYLFPRPDGGFVLGAWNVGWVVQRKAANGSNIWTKAYNSSLGYVSLRSMQQTPDGGYILAGESLDGGGDVGVHYGGALSSDIWILKLDSNGNKLWSKVFGGSYDDVSPTVVFGPNNGYYIISSTFSNDIDCIGLHGPANSQADVFIVRLDSMGNKIWSKCFGGTKDDGSRGACINGKGGVVALAYTSSTNNDVHNFHGGITDYWLLNVDSSGTIKWDNCFGNPNSYVMPADICYAPDGSFWATGNSGKKGGQVDTGYGGSDVWIIQVDSTGNLKRARVLGTPDSDDGTMIAALANGNVITGGNYGGTAANGTMPTQFWGETDGFLTILSPRAVAVKEVKKNMEDYLFVYPNPAQGILNVRVTDGRQGEISVLDTKGNTVISSMQISSKNILTIPVSNLATGTYYVRYKQKNANIDIKKITIN